MTVKRELYYRILKCTETIVCQAKSSDSDQRFRPIVDKVEMELTSFIGDANSEDERSKRKEDAVFYLGDILWYLSGELEGIGADAALEHLQAFRTGLQQDIAKK
jgi:hypothetical protein